MAHPLHQVLILFATEVREQLQDMGEALIQLDADDVDRKPALQRLARHAHTMKGNAGSLGLPELETMMHALEAALEPYKKSGGKLPQSLSKLLLEALDVVAPHVDAVIAEQPPPSLKAMIAAFEQPRTPTPVPALPPEPRPSAPDFQDEPVPLASAPSLVRPPPELEDRTPTPASKDTPISSKSAVMTRPKARGGDGGQAAADTLRISAARIATLDQKLEELREVRGTLDHRADEVRQLVQRLDAGVDADGLKLLRDAMRAVFRGLNADSAELAARLAEATDEVRAIRMLPVATLMPGLRRGVWEHTRQVGKRAELTAAGTDLSLDRRVIDELKEALLHLSRNAIDHGLEDELRRQTVGKPPVGHLHLAVEARHGRALLTFSDDGAGVDLERVREAAVLRGELTVEAAKAASAGQLYEVLFSPGFSTAQQVTKTSGRGVGLNVVRENLTRVGGTVRLESTPGQGSRFVLDVPLSVASAQALVVEASAHRLALPLTNVVASQLVSLSAGALPSVEVSGVVLPVRTLSGILRLPAPAAPRRLAPVVVLRAQDRLLAVAVDAILGERDVVLRPIPRELARFPALSSATQLGDGRLAFVLAPRALVELAGGAQVTAQPFAETSKRRVIVCDDSLTTRTLHRQVLESAGFEVETAPDGEEAYRLLREHGADLIVSDVRMPRLDGLGLARRVRQDQRFANLPLILISSLDTDDDRKRAEDAGASAYVTKQSYQRGELLVIARRLLERL